jgi:hypothetical protein
VTKIAFQVRNSMKFHEIGTLKNGNPGWNIDRSLTDHEQISSYDVFGCVGALICIKLLLLQEFLMKKHIFNKFVLVQSASIEVPLTFQFENSTFTQDRLNKECIFSRFTK